MTCLPTSDIAVSQFSQRRLDNANTNFSALNNMTLYQFVGRSIASFITFLSCRKNASAKLDSA